MPTGGTDVKVCSGVFSEVVCYSSTAVYVKGGFQIS